MLGAPPWKMLGSGPPQDELPEWTADCLEHLFRMARKLTKERLDIALDRIERSAIVVLSHPSAQDPKQVIQRLQLWCIGREEDRCQPGAMPVQERSNPSHWSGRWKRSPPRKVPSISFAFSAATSYGVHPATSTSSATQYQFPTLSTATRLPALAPPGTLARVPRR
jgi:hypothetical protein